MDELQNVSIHHTTSKIVNNVKILHQYNEILKNVQKIACSSRVDKSDLRNSLEDELRKMGVETEIRNLVFHMVRNGLNIDSSQHYNDSIVELPTQSSSQELPVKLQKQLQLQYPLNKTIKNFNQSDDLLYLKRASYQWERRVRKSLVSMCTELNIIIQGQVRELSDREVLRCKWEELSNYNIDLSGFRPVYAPKDLLEVLLSLKGPNVTDEDDIKDEFIDMPKWEFCHIQIKVKNLNDLRNLYHDLFRNESLNKDNANINVQCQRVLDTRHAPLCQHLLKKGNIPPSFRGALWSHVLNTANVDPDCDYWKSLKTMVLNTDHIVDKLIFKDIQLTASNDDQYFVFEDVLYQVMLCFSRDTKICSMIKWEPYGYKSKHYEAPPSGIIPFHGICMFAAPFCYLYDSPKNLYFTFRAFYTRYCYRLTSINTNPQGIVSLCLLFERLMQCNESELWLHFQDLDIKPIRIVFKWLMRAFSGHLPPEQLLILWDLILGFDSLEILPLFAVIILSFRKESLLQVNSLENIDAILADLSSIQVMPLIQLALSSH